MRRGVLHRLSHQLHRTFGSVLESVDLVDRDEVPVQEIEAGLLTQALAADVGGHILAVTDADLLDSQSDGFSQYMFGGKDNRNHVAVVSTRRLRPSGRRLRVERLLKVCLHEVGHNFGLAHHYSMVRAAEPEDGYCPMSKGDYNRYGERAYLRAIVDARGLSFCRQCSLIMRAAMQASR